MIRPPLNQPTPSWQLVPRSIQLASQHIEQILFLFLLPSLLLLLGQLLVGDLKQLQHLSEWGLRQQLGLVCFILGSLWSVLNFGPALYFRTRVVDGERPALGQCYKQGLRFFWRLVFYYLCLSAILIAGFVAFILPGLILLVLYVNRYYLSQYYIVGHGLSIKAGMQACRRDSETFRNAIWGLVGVQLATSLLVGVLGLLGVIGTLAAEIINAGLFFLAALRYQEMLALNKVPAIKLAGKK